MHVKANQLLLCLFTMPVLCMAQWQQMGTLEGGVIRDFEKVNNTLWSASLGGIYQSTDDGMTWQKDQSFPGSWAALNITKIGEDLYAILYEHRPLDPHETVTTFLYRRKEGGSKWEEMMSLYGSTYTLSENHQVFRIDNHLFLAQGTSLFRSDQPGVVTQVDYFDDGYVGFPFAVGHNNEGLLLATHWGLYLSLDLGESWDSLASYDTDFPPVIEDSLIIVPGYYASYRSSDLGQTWDTLPLPEDFFYGPLKRGDSGILYAIGEYLVFASEDNGSSWKVVVNDFHFDLRDVVEINDSTLGISSEDGFCRISKDGTHIHASNSGFNGVPVHGLSVSPDDELFISTHTANLRSTDTGASWSDWSTVSKTHALSFVLHWFHEDSAYAISSSDRLYLCTADMNEFDQIAPEDGARQIAFSSNTLFALDRYSLLWKSTDHGLNWEKVHFPSDADATSLNVFGEVIIIVDIEDRIWKSINHGKSWSIVYTSSNDRIFDAAIYHFGNSLLLTTKRTWLISEDMGSSWQELNPLGLPVATPPVTTLVARDNVLFALIPGHGVYVSFSEGLYWEPYNEGLGTLRGLTLSVMNNTLILGTFHGSLWQRDIEETLQVAETPTSADLTIFPVPVSDEFQILLPPQAGDQVQVDVFQIDGRLVFSEVVAPHDKTVSITNLQFKEGMFFVTIKDGNHRYSGKFVAH